MYKCIVVSLDVYIIYYPCMEFIEFNIYGLYGNIWAPERKVFKRVFHKDHLV